MNQKELTERISKQIARWEVAIAERQELERQYPAKKTQVSTDMLTFAQAVCARLKLNNVGIPTRIPADVRRDDGTNDPDVFFKFNKDRLPDKCHYSKPLEVSEAQQDRKAMLCVGLDAELTRYFKRFPCDTEQSAGELMARISQASLDVPWGLKLRKACVEKIGKNGKITLEAIAPDSTFALPFYEKYVLNVFDQMDALYSRYGAHFRASLPQNVSALTLEQWCSAWTRSAVAVAADWLIRTGHGTLESAAAAIWRWRDLPELSRKYSAIPTKIKCLSFELRAAPMLCQLLEHDHLHWLGKEEGGNSMVRFVVRDIIESRINSWTYYHGRKTVHIYLVLLIQQLAQILEDTPKETSMQEMRTVVPPEGLPPELAHELVPAQFKGAHALLALHEGRVKPPSREASKWFAGADAAEPSRSMAPAATALAPWPVEVKYLDTRHIVLASTDADLGPLDIGRLRTPWPLLGDQVYWLDTVLVVRRNGKWSVLPVVLEAEQLDEEMETDNADELDEVPEERVTVTLQPQYAEDWPVSQLRMALARSQWAYRTDGLGAFLCGAVDLDRRVGWSPSSAC